MANRFMTNEERGANWLQILQAHARLEEKMSNDPVNHPKHYTTGKIEVIDFIEDQGLGYHLGQVIKYVSRSAHKGAQIQDLEKARWYLNREIDRLKKSVQS